MMRTIHRKHAFSIFFGAITNRKSDVTIIQVKDLERKRIGDLRTGDLGLELEGLVDLKKMIEELQIKKNINKIENPHGMLPSARSIKITTLTSKVRSKFH